MSTGYRGSVQDQARALAMELESGEDWARGGSAQSPGLASPHRVISASGSSSGHEQDDEAGLLDRSMGDASDEDELLLHADSDKESPEKGQSRDYDSSPEKSFRLENDDLGGMGDERGEDYEDDEDDGLEDDEDEELDFDDDIPDIVEDADLGSPASPITKERFVPLATQAVDVSVGMRLLVKRSNGDWCHAEVCAYEAWPPEGGTVTLQVGDGLRKTLNLAKERHISIVRVPLPKSSQRRRGRSRRGGGDRRGGRETAAESPDGAKSPPARTASANSFAMSDAFTAEGPGSSNGGGGGIDLEEESEEEVQGSRPYRGEDRRSRSRSRDGYHSTGARSQSASRDRLSSSPAGAGASSSPSSPPLASSARPRSTSRDRNNNSSSRGRSSAGHGDDDSFRFGAGGSSGGLNGGGFSGLAPLPNIRKPSTSAGRPAHNTSPPAGGSYGPGGGASRSASMPPPSELAPSPFSLPPGLNALSSAGAASPAARRPTALATTDAASGAPGSPLPQQQQVVAGASTSPLNMLDHLLSPGPLSPADMDQPMRYLSQASFEAADFGPASSSAGDGNGVLSPSRDASAIPEEENGGALGGGGNGAGGGGGYSGEEDDSGGEGGGGEAGRSNHRSSSGAARDGTSCDLETAKVLFKSMAEPMPLDKGVKVIVQRSDSTWAHATVDRFENWPPEGGTVTVKLGKTTRKALDLSKPHHLRRLRLPRDPTALNGVGTALVRTKTGPGLMIGSAEVDFERADFGVCAAFSGMAVAAVPKHAHVALENAAQLAGQVAVVHRGVCPFTEKARRLVAAGVTAIVFVNTKDELTVPADPSRDCADLEIPVLLVTSSAGMLLTPGTTVRQTPAAADADALIATRLALLCSDPHVTPALLATFCANHPRAWAVNAVAAESAAAAASAAAATSSGAGGRASSPSVVSSPSAVSALHALVSNPSFSLALFEAAAAAAAAEGSRDPNLGNAGGGDAGGKEQQQLPRLLCHLATITDSLHPLGRLPLHGLASNSHALLAADVAGQAYELVDAVAALYPNALHTADSEKHTPFGLLQSRGLLAPEQLQRLNKQWSSSSGASDEKAIINGSNNEGVRQELDQAQTSSSSSAQPPPAATHQDSPQPVPPLRVSSRDDNLSPMSPSVSSSSSEEPPQPPANSGSSGGGAPDDSNNHGIVEHKAVANSTPQTSGQANSSSGSSSSNSSNQGNSNKNNRSVGVRGQSNVQQPTRHSAPPQTGGEPSGSTHDAVSVAAALAEQATEHQAALKAKDEELAAQRREAQEAAATKDKRIGLLERQLDTLAAQLNVNTKTVLSSEVRAWLDEGGLEVYALMFHALGVDTLEDLLDAALVGDDELVLAGMDEDDAAKFHTLRFRTAKKRREDAKKKATDGAAGPSLSSSSSSPPRTAMGQQPVRGGFAEDHFVKPSSPKSPKSKAAFFPPQPAVDEDDGDDDDDEEEENDNDENAEQPENANDAEDAGRASPATAAGVLASTLHQGSAGDGNADDNDDNDSVSSSEAELAKAKVEEDDNEEEEEEDAKEAQSMESFLGQLAFLPDDAATYAAVLAHLGCHSPKDLHNVTQATLTQAGIKKFHARKICSAEIYRAFL